MSSTLQQYNPQDGYSFVYPSKRINEGQDVQAFLVSKAYHDITTFLVQLNRAMFPWHETMHTAERPSTVTFDIGSSSVISSKGVAKLAKMFETFDMMADEVPLDPGPRRFGNVAFRKWCQLLEDRAPKLLRDHLPASVLSFPHVSEDDAVVELQSYLLGSFGSSQRLDYGTGHELSFLAFLGGVWKLGGFRSTDDDNEARAIVLGLLNPYLQLVRKLILKYSLEPAGTHGVWGLDDHSFLPYIFGSAQLGPAITDKGTTPTEGSRSNAPNPASVADVGLVEKERNKNLYFGAIGFIYDVKKGPFWEHSPTLYDISGVKAGWAKINKGMLKMYDAEVLSKFPVVQHFPFGSLFSWDKDPDAKAPSTSVHMANQPQKQALTSTTQASPGSQAQSISQAPWVAAKAAGATTMPPTQAPWAAPSQNQRSGVPTASGRSEAVGSRDQQATMRNTGAMPPPTKAPWAK